MNQLDYLIPLVIIIAIAITTFAALVQRWEKATKNGALNPAQRKLCTLIIMLCAGCLAYRFLTIGRLEQTAALFVGLPTLLSVIAVLGPKSESVIGMIMKGITIALLMSGIVLGEGFICILMSAPIFYLIGFIVGLILNRTRKPENSSVANSFFILPLLIMSLEGTLPELSFPRSESITVSKTLQANSEKVWQTLAQSPNFSSNLPPFLMLGFPAPVKSTGSGLEIGSFRKIKFAGGEGSPGELLLEISEKKQDMVVFKTISDSSHVAHWLDWKKSKVRVVSTGPENTLVSWTLEYERRLDPAWYFAPWERYAVKLAAQFLIDELTIPKS